MYSSLTTTTKRGKNYDTVLQNTRTHVPLTHRRGLNFAGSACVTCAGVTRNRYFIAECACYERRGRRCSHSKTVIKFLTGCSSNNLYIMCLLDKNVCASAALLFLLQASRLPPSGGKSRICKGVIQASV